MDKLTKYILKREFKKRGLKALDKLEKIPVRDGVYLNVLNTGRMVDLSKLIKKAREFAVKEVKKAVKKL
jgi:hypothetical protein